MTMHTQFSVVPANQARCYHLTWNFGVRGEGANCQCQCYELQAGEAFRSHPAAVRAERLHRQTNCGHADADTTSGLVAYFDGEPVG